MKIIGEEDLSFTNIPEFEFIINDKIQELKNIDNIKNNDLPPSFVFEQQYEAKELCLWIDPLDCTSGFTNKRYY